MRLTNRKLTNAKLRGSVLQRADISDRYSPKITLAQALWCLYPLLFYYAWEGILW